MERMRIEADIRMNQKPMTAEEYVEYKIQHPKQREVRRFNNGRYEWIAEGGEPDLYSLMASYRMHEFMSERYKRIAVTNCPNCGAPYTGKNTCEYCGTMFPTAGGGAYK
jgi:hypothetical protein